MRTALCLDNASALSADVSAEDPGEEAAKGDDVEVSAGTEATDPTVCVTRGDIVVPTAAFSDILKTNNVTRVVTDEGTTRRMKFGVGSCGGRSA